MRPGSAPHSRAVSNVRGWIQNRGFARWVFGPGGLDECPLRRRLRMRVVVPLESGSERTTTQDLDSVNSHSARFLTISSQAALLGSTAMMMRTVFLMFKVDRQRSHTSTNKEN